MKFSKAVKLEWKNLQINYQKLQHKVLVKSEDNKNIDKVENK